MEIQEFYRLLQQGPAFLLLGQRYLQLASGTDPFLTEVLRKYGEPSEAPVSYSDILAGHASQFPEEALAWMQHRCDRLSVPKWLESIAAFPWSGIYSSAIDSIWPRAFTADWRELHRLFEEKYKPADPRNTFRLHCTYLFGCVSRADTTERPPLTDFEFLKRKQVAVSLARRIPENVTPMGILAIEGYAGDDDWLSLADLLPIIDEMGPGQTHVFSVTSQFKKSPYVADLVNRGDLILHSESLFACLVRGEKAGYIRLGRPPEQEEHGGRIRIGDVTLKVPPDIWTQISRTATVLDDALLVPPSPVSEDALYRKFRNFLSESGVGPVWTGYARGFAFHREFEDVLRAEVDKRLRSRETQDDPIILHGQTGTGKTVALGKLAYEIRQDKEYPVLFIERRSQRILPVAIDSFCQWAEDAGAPKSLVVWDGMVDLEEYFDLVQYLVGRGRKVVVVGSAYRIQTEEFSHRCLVEAPRDLTEQETSALHGFLDRFSPSLRQVLAPQRTPVPASFLVALYRLLPPTRARIRTGITTEVGYAEQEIMRKAQEWVPEIEGESPVAYALLKAGLITDQQILSSRERDVGSERVSGAEELVGLVMVPGQFGHEVPFEVVLRALGKQAYSNFLDLLTGVDIFRWHESSTGNITIGPRHPLEAKLFVHARLGGPRTEVAFARSLLIEIKERFGAYDGPEVEFAIDLIRSMGPNALQRTYFAPYFRDLADALSTLRQERNVENPRLILQEANLLREWVVCQTRAGETHADLEEPLDRAEAALHRAIEILQQDYTNPKLHASILLELSSLLGTRAHQCLDSDQLERAAHFFERARDQLQRARVVDPESYYPIDVLFWTTRDMIEAGVLQGEARIEAEADLLHAFDMADVEGVPAAQQEKYYERRMRLGDLLDQESLTQEAFEALAARGSAAGYYIRASQIAGDIRSGARLSSLQRERSSEAVSYLDANRDNISHDGRCLFLLLRLWWASKTGKPLFYGERQTLPFNKEEWTYCLGLVADLMQTSTLYDRPSLLYLHGLACFHLDRVEQAFDVFRQVERDSSLVRGRRRIVRHYLASNPDNTPKRFSGTVRWLTDDSTKGGLYVEELRRNVQFIPHDFRRPDIQQHEPLPEFYIAFNFLGPIADSPRYVRHAQKANR